MPLMTVLRMLQHQKVEWVWILFQVKDIWYVKELPKIPLLKLYGLIR